MQADLPRVLKQPVRGDGQPGTLGELRLRPAAAEPLSAYASRNVGGCFQRRTQQKSHENIPYVLKT